MSEQSDLEAWNEDRMNHDEDYYRDCMGEDDEPCPWCGGEGYDEYQNCPESWGEDCPSLVNHIITCPKCNGSGKAKDCDVL